MRALLSAEHLLLLVIFCAFTLSVQTASGQHPVEVQRKAAQGEYFEALRLFDKMPKRIATTESVIAAGKSAWALGLPARAIEEFEKALRDENLDRSERARLLLSRAIIEYQEGRYRVSILFAEKSMSVLRDATPLRGKAWLIWGESLSRLKSFGSAEHKYLKALEETPAGQKAEVHYLIGATQVKLGKNRDAREHFEKIPLDHDYTPEAIRYLASISIDEGEFREAAFWLARGRKDYPNRFLDSWVDYALLQVAVSGKDRNLVERIQKKAQQKYPPSDQWLTLLNAAAEAYEWQGQVKDMVKGKER